MANNEAHARTRTVGPRTQHDGPDRKEQATSHSKVLHSKFCTDCNGSVHDLFQVRALQICNGNLGQLTVTGLWKYIL